MLESLKQRNLYRGPASSEEFNQRNRIARQDIAKIYQLTNENEQEIERNMDIVLRENFFLSNHVQELKKEVDRLTALVTDNVSQDTLGGTNNVFVQNFYSTDSLENSLDGRSSNIDRTHGVVSPLAINTLSRFGYQTDSGQVFIPNKLNIFIKEGNNTNLDENGDPVLIDIITDNTHHIVDKSKNTFWVRTQDFLTTDSVTEMVGEVHIQIPTEGFQNLYTNTLMIHPYPEGSMTIKDIQYKGYGDQWHRLETYPVDATYQPVKIKDARKLIFQFPNTEMIELKISYSQPYWFEHENYSQFTYGFQNISLEYRTYTEKACEFLSIIDISDKNSRFTRIEEPEVIAAGGGIQNLNDMVEHHLYYDPNFTTEFSFGANILSNVDTVYVKTILQKQGNAVPVLSEVRIPYRYQEK